LSSSPFFFFLSLSIIRKEREREEREGKIMFLKFIFFLIKRWIIF
jgi:hypothetical protein